VLTLFGLVLGSCSINVHTKYDKTADFKQYKTFCWMDGCEFKFSGPGYLNDSLLRENLKKAIIEELTAKGLAQNTDNPDLLVGFTITLKDEQSVIYHRSENGPFYKPLDGEREVINYLKGTLIIGLADKKESRIVWESFAIGYLDLNPDFSEKNVRKGIKLVLRDYPPKKEVN
jgi:Domain of unknown function (DUF4136)